MSWVWAAAVLFACGCIVSIVLHLLHVEHGVTQDQRQDGSVPTWIPLSSGLASVFIGFSTPQLHRAFNIQSEHEWETVIRCAIGFLGLCYGSAKLPFDSNSAELSISLAAAAVGLWYLGDRTLPSFVLGMTTATFGTLIVQWLVYLDVIKYTQPDFFFVRSWLPCILFAASITFGTLGRQLASDQRATVSGERRQEVAR